MKDKRQRPKEREEEKSGRSVNSSKNNNNQSSLDTINNETKADQYSIFNSTRNNPITPTSPSMLPILNFEA